LNFGILLFALVEAWLARNLSTEFQETQSIYNALTATLLVTFIGIPGTSSCLTVDLVELWAPSSTLTQSCITVLFLVRDNPDATAFVTSGLIFIFCISILLNLFVPKMMYERKRKTTQNVHISGVPNASPSASTTRLDDTTFPLTSEASDSEKGAVGDRILSTKTRQQLIEENDKLKKEIFRLREKERHSNGTVDENNDVKESHTAATD
jgi:hypothetical protein